jgi:hypothetical protein
MGNQPRMTLLHKPVTEYMKVLIIIPLLLIGFVLHAQLAVEVLPVKVGTQKAIVPLKFENHLPNSVDAARAVCFLLDANGKVVAQATRWVIGQKAPKLAPQESATFNFVITGPAPFSTTNLTAKVSFTRLLLATNVVGDVRKDIHITMDQN